MGHRWAARRRDSAAAAFLEDFYLRRGFEVYEAAYSRWSLTAQSIPELLSLGHPIDVKTLDRTHLRLQSNPYFARLVELGYVIHVSESSFLDYCRSTDVSVASCEEAPAVSIANVAYLRGGWRARIILAARFLLNMNSHVYVRLYRDDAVWRRSFAGRGLAELEHVRDAIAARPPAGTAFFVHLMLPHRPLEVSADCAVYRDLAKRVGYPEPRAGESTLRASLPLYVGQVRCVHQAVADLLTALDRTVGRDGAIVIVQGDHGSRWMEDNPREAGLVSMRGPQLNSALSTLLAIRRPQVPPALHTEAVPVQDSLWELVGHDFAGKLDRPWAQFVRRAPTESLPRDTLRVLGDREMPWVRRLP
jgi:hypothetical protein